MGGVIKRVAMTHWAKLIHREINDLVIFDSSTEPNMEDIMNLNAEFVICHDYQDLDAQLDELDIPVCDYAVQRASKFRIMIWKDFWIFRRLR